MGEQVNSRRVNVLGWITTAVTFSATAGLVATWFMQRLRPQWNGRGHCAAPVCWSRRPASAGYRGCYGM